jgi:uncharacterized protein
MQKQYLIKKIAIQLIAWISLSWIFLLTPIQAASFDCSKAKSPFEKTICTDPEISTFDETLANSYNNAKKMLSDEGKRILSESQNRWLHFVNDVCFKYKNDRDVNSSSSHCVELMYRGRISDMKTAAIQIGPFMFSRIDYYFSKSDDEFRRPFQGQTSYPRIDNPLSESQKKWNAVMASKSNAEGEGWCDEGSCDVYIGFEVKSATETIISTQRTEWMYGHGNHHGIGRAKGMTYILKPELHLLTASDLFAPDKSWETFLTDKCYSALEIKAQGTKINRDLVEDVATDASEWYLTNKALVIYISPSEILAFGAGSTVVTIPWKELQPFLLSTAPIPR